MQASGFANGDGQDEVGARRSEERGGLLEGIGAKREGQRNGAGEEAARNVGGAPGVADGCERRST